MTKEYDFEMVKRAYAEMARRSREKDEIRRLPRGELQQPQYPQQPQESPQRQPYPA